MRFDAFVEECAGVCFSCSLPDRCNVVECFTKVSWLAASWYRVAKQRQRTSEIHRHMLVSERRTGATNGTSLCVLARILGSYSAESTQEQFDACKSNLCVCNHLTLRVWSLLTTSSPWCAERELPLGETL